LHKLCCFRARLSREEEVRASSRRLLHCFGWKRLEPSDVGCYNQAGIFFPSLASCRLAVTEPNVNRPFYLPRLPREYYQGDAVVHWTLAISHRQQGWLDEGFHAAFRELVLHTAARGSLFCPTYCLMPDHLHLIWMGLRLDSDQLKSIAFLRTHLKPKLAPQKFQHQAHDHVLKEKERRRNAFARVCHYILENPLRAELVADPAHWLFSGAVVPGYPTLHPLQDDFWAKFWKLYGAAKAPNAGNILRPPIS
jgi:putative transposase